MNSVKMNHDQYNKLMTLLNASESPAAFRNEVHHVTSIVCLASAQMNEPEWVVDSGASCHITSHAHSLEDIKLVKNPYSVILANG